MSRFVTASLLATVAGSVLLAGAVPAAADPTQAPSGSPAASAPSNAAPTVANQPNDCTRGGGVWVVVEFDGKTLRSGCATNPADGLDALKKIGADVATKEAGSMGAMICAVDGKPADGCTGPFTGSYWAYSHAAKVGAGLSPWTMSTEGAANYHPEPGTMEGWNYSTGAAPAPVTGTDSTSTSVAMSTSVGVTASPTPAPAPEKKQEAWPTILLFSLLLLAIVVGGGYLARRKRRS